MFDLSFAEMMVAGAVALVVLGPERLPKVARTVGEWTGKIQRLANNVKQELNAQADWAELNQLKQLKNQVEETAQELRQNLNNIKNNYNNQYNIPAWERLPEQKTPEDFGIYDYQSSQHSQNNLNNLNNVDLDLDDLKFKTLIGFKTQSIKKQSLNRKRQSRPNSPNSRYKNKLKLLKSRSCR